MLPFKQYLCPGKNGSNQTDSSPTYCGYRFITHMYCRTVQVGFYSDAVECKILIPADRVRSPISDRRKMLFFRLLHLASNVNYHMCA